MPRAIWKGNIAFGLVQIPVTLQSAEEPNQLSFDLLDRRDFSPIGYEKINKRTGKKVEREDIVKGFLHSEGEYVVLSNDDFEQANIEATHNIDIDRIVDVSEIDPIYFERPYYIAPEKQGKKAYALLRDTLRDSNKVGIARIVIRTRQHLAALFPRDDGLILVLLRFADEIRKSDTLDLPRDSQKLGITSKELDMAKTLVESMVDTWDPTAYKDDYREDLMALINDRVKQGQVNKLPGKAPSKRATANRPAPIIDLVSILKESVRQRSDEPQHANRNSSKGSRTRTPKSSVPTVRSLRSSKG
jgi:DNA end-binding protein Ku